MSAKNRDNKNRWRNITVGFRVSPEENERINALKQELAAVLAELQRIEAGNGIDEELLNLIELVSVILGGLKGEEQNE